MPGSRNSTASVRSRLQNKNENKRGLEQAKGQKAIQKLVSTQNKLSRGLPVNLADLPPDQIITFMTMYNDTFAIYSPDPDTRQAVADGIQNDAKQFNVTVGGTCSAPNYLAWTSDDHGGCNPQSSESGPVDLSSLKKDQVVPTPNSVAKIFTCGDPSTPHYQAEQTAFAASAANTCLSQPPPPLSEGEKIGLGVGIGVGIPALLGTFFLIKYCSERTSDPARQQLINSDSSTNPNASATAAASGATATSSAASGGSAVPLVATPRRN